MMSLRDIKKIVGALSPKDLEKLTAWLHALVEDRASKKLTRSANKRGQALRARRTISKSYRLEHVRCGKATCKCSEGKLHGPYWYAYWSEGGKTRSQYVGKKLPRGVKTRKGSNNRGVR
jgi:Family of unknown function (DUF6788)